MRRFPGALTLLSLLLCGSVWSQSARAYEEQASADVAAGGTILAGAEVLNAYGPQLSVGASRGLSDLFVARAQLGYAPLFESGDLDHVGLARAEVAYLVDVLQLVPFFGLGGSLWLYDDRGVRVRPGVHLVIGLDYLWSRSWTLGLDVRTGLLFELGNVASATDFQLRISRMFDLF